MERQFTKEIESLRLGDGETFHDFAFTMSEKASRLSSSWFAPPKMRSRFAPSLLTSTRL